MSSKFAGVTLTPDVARQLRQAKQAMAEGLECLLQEGTINKEMTIPELIVCLKGNVN